MKRKLSDRLLLAFAPRFASVVIRLLHMLLRIETLGEEQISVYWKKKESVIISFWHDQLLLMIKGYRGPGARILISPSKDGELIARTMQCFGQDAVRGSSSRGGREAFRALVAFAKEPYDLVITPDGPKGPRHKVKDGVVQLARLTGRPVVPMAFVSSKGHRFGSWDRFLFPFPWGRGIYRYGEPVIYSKGEDVDAFRERIQRAMDENTLSAGEYLKRYDDTAV